MAKYPLKVGEQELEPEIEERPDGSIRVRLDGRWRDASLYRLGGSPRYVLTVDGKTVDVLAREVKSGLEVYVGGATYRVEQGKRAQRRPASEDSDRLVDGKWLLRSPLTGAVMDVRVQPGDMVEAGQVILVVEAMKMQNELRSRVAGKVTAVNTAVGERVETGAVLAEVTANQQAPPDRA